MKTSAFAIIVILLNINVATAAIPKKATSEIGAMETTKSHLSLPLDERLQKLASQGPQGYRNLVKIMFNENAPMDVRWKAVTAAGRIGGKDARPEILRALKSNTWFMKSAGLLAMRAIDRNEALVWSRKFLSDSALAVRADAVDMIHDLGDKESVAVLWEKINAPENFRNGQSLYVRRRMAETLQMLDSRSGREAKFIALLNDRDEALHEIAMQALSSITKQSMGNIDMAPGERRAMWLNWWKTKSI